jgi:hypothetical protein
MYPFTSHMGCSDGCLVSAQKSSQRFALRDQVRNGSGCDTDDLIHTGLAASIILRYIQLVTARYSSLQINQSLLNRSEPPGHLRIGIHVLDLLRPVIIDSDGHIARFHEEDFARLVRRPDGQFGKGGITTSSGVGDRRFVGIGEGDEVGSALQPQSEPTGTRPTRR